MIVLAIETLNSFLNTNSRLSNFVSHFFTNKMNLFYKISMYVTFNTRRHLIMYIKTFVIKDLITWNKVILLGSRLNVNVHNPWIWHRSGMNRWHIYLWTIWLNNSRSLSDMLTFVVNAPFNILKLLSLDLCPQFCAKCIRLPMSCGCENR